MLHQASSVFTGMTAESRGPVIVDLILRQYSILDADLLSLLRRYPSYTIH